MFRRSTRLLGSLLDDYNLLSPSASDNLTAIHGYTPNGFMINGMLVHGSTLVFPHSVFGWHVRSLNELTPASLSLVKLHAPPTRLLVIGTGETMVVPSQDVYESMKASGISIEVMSTPAAIGTLSHLFLEGRQVAGALFPTEKFCSPQDHNALE